LTVEPDLENCQDERVCQTSRSKVTQFNSNRHTNTAERLLSVVQRTCKRAEGYDTRVSNDYIRLPSVAVYVRRGFRPGSVCPLHPAAKSPEVGVHIGLSDGVKRKAVNSIWKTVPRRRWSAGRYKRYETTSALLMSPAIPRLDICPPGHLPSRKPASSHENHHLSTSVPWCRSSYMADVYGYG